MLSLGFAVSTNISGFMPSPCFSFWLWLSPTVLCYLSVVFSLSLYFSLHFKISLTNFSHFIISISLHQYLTLPSYLYSKSSHSFSLTFSVSISFSLSPPHSVSVLHSCPHWACPVFAPLPQTDPWPVSYINREPFRSLATREGPENRCAQCYIYQDVQKRPPVAPNNTLKADLHHSHTVLFFHRYTSLASLMQASSVA